MKNQRIWHAFVIFILLLVGIFILLKYYSGKVSIYKDGLYEVFIQVKGEYEEAEEVKNKIYNSTALHVVFEKVSKNQYYIAFGRFPNSYEAGIFAFGLYCDSVINNYSVALDGKKVSDNFTDLIFVSSKDGRASLYSINLVSKKVLPVWNDFGEDVVSFAQSPKKNYGFFLTTGARGWKTGLPYLYDARLYYFNRDIGRIRLIEYLKNGNQFYSFWNSRNQYMTSFASLDSSTNRKVFQNIAIYDTSGSVVSTSSKTFDLVKDGFPNPPLRKLELVSTMNKYIVYTKNDENGENSIIIKRAYSNDENLILKSAGSMKDIAWAVNEKYLFLVFSSRTKTRRKIEKIEDFLIIYDAESKKIIRTFNGMDFRNLSVYGPLLAVETGAGSSSRIIFYNYETGSIFYNLQLDGGCAIKNLPISK